ncbi:MAG: twin-arginine translocase subunit TatB [Gammaproteobacteria bacterium]|nr:MAG: twin-arginine translocase subunit TatB [Gammaproteobacteria bacterium]
MFDIGFWEVFVIGIIALFVVGPERLPDLARKAGVYYSKLSRFISGVKADIDREMGAGNLQELKDVQEQFRQAQQEFKSAGKSIID